MRFMHLETNSMFDGDMHLATNPVFGGALTVHDYYWQAYQWRSFW